MPRKHLGVALALAVSLIGGPATIAVAQPISPVASSFVNSSAVNIAQAPAKTVKTTTANLNLRKTASTASGSLILIPKNTALTITKTSGIWHQVTYKSKTGWVSGDYLKATATAAVYYYAKAYTAVKAKASSSSSTVVSLHRQYKVEVLGKSGSWTKIRVSGKTGFVPTSILVKASPASVFRWANGKQRVFQSTRTTSKTIVTLSNNSRVTWLRASGSWQQVRTTAGIGWVQSKNLSAQAIKAPVAKPAVYNYTKAYTALKAKASSSSSTVVSLHRQSKVEVLGKSGSWTKIRVSGKTGFVPSSVLMKARPASVFRWANGKQRVFQSTRTTSKTITTLSNNSRVTWLRASGSWQQVRTTAGIGWVQSKNLSAQAIKPPVAKPPVPSFKTAKWSTSAVNVRTGGGTSFASLGVIPAGEKVMSAGSTGGWANVKTSKGTGWVSDAYLSSIENKPAIDDKPATIKFRWTTANLNLRNGNTATSPILGIVPMGEKITYLESKDGWARVATSEGTGWVSESYLSMTAYKPGTGSDAGATEFRWARGNTNLRSGNATSYSILGVVPAGEKVTYLESEDGWARVVTSEGTGWMSESLLSKTIVAQLQPDTLAVMDAVRKYYQPIISSIGGVRSGSIGHSAGKAADIMIKDYKNPLSIAEGDEMAQFLIDNRKSLGISYLIWQDKIWLGPTKGWEEYSKSGKYGSQFSGNWNDTTRHMDHIHAETYGNSGTRSPLVK